MSHSDFVVPLEWGHRWTLISLFPTFDSIFDGYAAFSNDFAAVTSLLPGAKLTFAAL